MHEAFLDPKASASDYYLEMQCLVCFFRKLIFFMNKWPNYCKLTGIICEKFMRQSLRRLSPTDMVVGSVRATWSGLPCHWKQQVIRASRSVIWSFRGRPSWSVPVVRSNFAMQRVRVEQRDSLCDRRDPPQKKPFFFLKCRRKRGRMFILDGGLGGEIDRRLMPTHPTQSGDQAWTARAHESHPELVRTIHADFVESGAQIVTSNTYAALKYLFSDTSDDAVRCLVCRAVELARSTCVGHARRVLVAGSLSAHDCESATEEELRHSLNLLARSLKDACVDVILVEMIQNVSVGRLMVDAAATAELPIMLGFSVRRDADGRLLFRRDDAPFDAQAVARVIGSCRPSAVGVMHCGLEVMDDALTVLAEAYDGPLMAYPDSGVFVDNVWRCGAGSSNANSATADQMFEFSCRHPRLRVVGGCCGYGPELVCELAQRFDSCADPHLLISWIFFLWFRPETSRVFSRVWNQALLYFVQGRTRNSTVR